jgi:hypothetical protein
MASVLDLERLDQGCELLGDAVQQQLARWNRDRLKPALPDAQWRKSLTEEQRMRELEGEFLETLRAEVSERAARVPQHASGFVSWFEALAQDGPGQDDPLFPWLAETAQLEDMHWYLEQEAAGEAGFDDLTAYTQVKLPGRIKLELARNYWDVMGRG